MIMDKLLTKETFKSKSFWVIIAMGIVEIGERLGFVPEGSAISIQTFLEWTLGITLVDRSTKLINGPRKVTD